MFGDLTLNTKAWPRFSLKEIADYHIGLTYKPTDVADEGTLVLRSSNIQNSELDFKDQVRVSKDINQSLFVREGDILMCSRNGSASLVGKVAKIPTLKEPCTFGAFMTVIRSQHSNFLFDYFQTEFFRHQITSAQTSTINQITKNMLDGIMIPLPEQSLLTQFSCFRQQVDKSKFAVQRGFIYFAPFLQSQIDPR